ncbi:SDR family oxidoreductase [Streptomyces sp. NPDC059271]|uniref:SDR family oxidoreductase n=1 Tax=Streptomyces sp. NPDC059271 TaxID=3346799 RepID=UPI003690EE88
MDFTNVVALVTGANRGLGREFTRQLLERGARVYAAARRPETIDAPGAVPLRLDVTDASSIAAAAAAAPDVTLLVNNAGILTNAPLISGDFDDVYQEMETNYFGTLRVTRAFAPVLESNGGGSILNVLSVLSWFHPAQMGAYSASKAAGWALSNAAREELASRNISVTSLHVGYMDTAMAATVTDPKNDPATVATTALDGLARGATEVLADDITRQVKANLSTAG